MKYVWLISIWCMHLVCSAQIKDTLNLEPFELISSKASSGAGALKINLPLPYSGSIADVIGSHSALFVKSYSPGNLATSSMRGMGAQHTAVLWNGINLQSVMNSNLDLNLLPVFFFDHAAIETGANAASAANGALAGAIYLNNQPKKLNQTFGEYLTGSFGLNAISIGSSVYAKNMFLNSKFVRRTARNDFEFVNYFSPQKPIERLRNSEFTQSGFMQELEWDVNAYNTIYANYWYMQTERDLPPAMGIANTFNEQQDDYSHKLLVKHLAQLSSKIKLSSQYAFINEQINYYNDLLLPAFNDANSHILESQLNWKLSPQLEFVSSINYTNQNARTDGYILGKQRHLISLWQSINYTSRNKKNRITLGTRQLMVNGEMVPASPDLGMDIKLNSFLKWKTNLAAGYRIPSFNDLYWQAGGNPNLLPEVSKKLESTLEIFTNGFKLATTAFLHHVNNWILWTPDPVSQIWRANNAKSVRSSGIELSSEYRHKFSDFHDLKVFGRYQFVRSINTQVYQSDSSALGKQLFYTPLNTASLQAQYRFKSVLYNLGLVYTGSVFTTADNTLDNQLPAYAIVNSSLAYAFKYKKHAAELSFKVLNLTNRTYQVMENRPMPLRNYQIAIKFNINYDK